MEPLRKRDSINWEWVRSELLARERIADLRKTIAKTEASTAVEEQLKRAKRLVTPKLIMAEKKVEAFTENAIALEDNAVLSGAQLSKYLRPAGDIVLFAVTIGDKLETEATAIMNKGDYLNGYILDRIGSFAVESMARRTEESLRDWYGEREASVSVRMSPGYCDWPIEDQRRMAMFLDLAGIGISITESCMLVPKKSITAAVGIGPMGSFARNRSQCDMCAQKDCDYRRKTSKR